jgi:hypothetical protein
MPPIEAETPIPTECAAAAMGWSEAAARNGTEISNAKRLGRIAEHFARERSS